MTLISNIDKPYQLFMPDGSGNTTLATLKSGERGSNPSKFRYFRLVVYKHFSNAEIGWETPSQPIIQFSDLKFMTQNEMNVYPFAKSQDFDDIKTQIYAHSTPYGEPCQGTDGDPSGEDYGTEGETLRDGIRGLGHKACIGGLDQMSLNYPAYFTYDLDREEIGRRLNISIYKKWKWYTSGDTSQNPWRNMRVFALEVSENKETYEQDKWYRLDYADLSQVQMEEGDGREAYSGTLVFPEIND